MDASGVVTAIVVDNPGSGYYTAPSVKVYNGTLYDPITCRLAAATAARAEMMQSNDQGRLAPESSAEHRRLIRPASPQRPLRRSRSAADCGAVATTTLTIQSITLDTFGAGYTSAPTVTIADPTGRPAPPPPPRLTPAASLRST